MILNHLCQMSLQLFFLCIVLPFIYAEISWPKNGNINIDLTSDCFIKCGDHSNHSGQIGLFTDNHRRCINWGNYTGKDPHNVGSDTTFCLYYQARGKWCATSRFEFNGQKYDWDYCKKEECRSIRAETHCHKGIELVTTYCSIEFIFRYISDKNDSVVVLYKDNDECYVMYIIYKNENKLRNFTKDFFPFCQHLNSQYGYNQSITLTPLPENTAYRIYVIPVFNDRTTGVVTRMNVRTTQKIKLTPAHIVLIDRSSSSITLYWPSLRDLNIPNFSHKLRMNCCKHRQIAMSNLAYGLDPCKEYCFTLILEDSISVEEDSVTKCFNTTTTISAINNVTKDQMFVKWSYNNKHNCPIVFEVSNGRNNNPSKFYTSEQVVNISSLSAGLDNVRVRALFVVDGNTTIYGDFASFPWDRKGLLSSDVLKVLISSAVCLVCLISISIYVIVKRWQRHRLSNNKPEKNVCIEDQNNKRTTRKSNDYLTVVYDCPSSSENIKSTQKNCDEFLSIFKSISKANITALTDEYKEICEKANCRNNIENLSTNIGTMPHNIKKNNYLNILPYDYNRVILKNCSFKDNYINASFIPQCNNTGQVEYIVAQGPIIETMADFVKMVWDEDVNTIVMFKERSEENECAQYWTNDLKSRQITKVNSAYSLLLFREVTTEHYVERSFEIFQNSTGKRKFVIQLQNVEGFDSAILNKQAFENLLFRFHELCNSTAKTPYLVHSSSGIGLTGIFIVFDRIIKKLAAGQPYIDIYNEVLELTKYRRDPVQGEAQYIFLYDFIHYFLQKYTQNGKTRGIISYYNQ